MVVELSMQYCGQITFLRDKYFRVHLRHLTFLRCIITQFDRKVDFQNHLFGWLRFENRFFLIIKCEFISRILFKLKWTLAYAVCRFNATDFSYISRKSRLLYIHRIHIAILNIQMKISFFCDICQVNINIPFIPDSLQIKSSAITIVFVEIER